MSTILLESPSVFQKNTKSIGLPYGQLPQKAGLLVTYNFLTPETVKIDPKPGPGLAQIWPGVFIPTNLKTRVDKFLEALPPLVGISGENLLQIFTGKKNIHDWRGSRLVVNNRTFIPLLPPDLLSRSPEEKHCTYFDFKRLKNLGTKFHNDIENATKNEFFVSPTFQQAKDQLNFCLAKLEIGETKIAVDIETRRGHIACIGFALTKHSAFCIPFLKKSNSPFYWEIAEETLLLVLISKLLLHKNAIIIGQNYLYDAQYIYKHWGIISPNVCDTMIGQHSLFNTLPKGLDYLSSIYCEDHIFWKNESKDWHKDVGEAQLWTYNCKDACITFEVWEELFKLQNSLKMQAHFTHQQNQFQAVLHILIKGVKISLTQKEQLAAELSAAHSARLKNLAYIAGHEINPNSSLQLKKFFYTDLGIPEIKNRKTKKAAVDFTALDKISNKYPQLQPFIQTLIELRSIKVFLSTFVNAELDEDFRMRTAYNIAGTATYRYSSSQNAFGKGANLQNLPKGSSKRFNPTYIQLPNIRKLYIPDEGMTFFDLDLDRADLQVVVWEADDEELKTVLKQGLDLHLVNASAIFNLNLPLEELKKGHRNYPSHLEQVGAKRDLAKLGVHAVNYGVGPLTLSQSLGISAAEAKKFISVWFEKHPGILSWHRRTEEQYRKQGYNENVFGARYYHFNYFNLNEALGWLPQSTVAITINKALKNVHDNGHPIEILLQVHDSIAGQFPTNQTSHCLTLLKDLTKITIPYPDPLIIPTGIKISPLSWGDCG